MTKLTKNKKIVQDKIEIGKQYTLEEAAGLVKEITTTKFDASVDFEEVENIKKHAMDYVELMKRY